MCYTHPYETEYETELTSFKLFRFFLYSIKYQNNFVVTNMAEV
jgi:hypothetical protein